jgi:hypothetical protein
MPVERTLDGHFRDERRIAALENAEADLFFDPKLRLRRPVVATLYAIRQSAVSCRERVALPRTGESRAPPRT